MRRLLVAPLLLLATFCAHRQNTDAATVRVSYRESDAARCTSLGRIHGSVDTSSGRNASSLDVEMRRKAARKGGNLIVFREARPTGTPAASGGTELEAIGDVFDCTRRAANEPAPSLPR